MATGNRTSPIRRKLFNHRLALSLVDWGNAEAPLVVLIHGSRDHARSWDALARVLRPDHRVVAIDLRGHGDSAWAPDGRYEFAAYLCDLDAMLAQLGVSAERPVTLIGHSLGAHIALRYAGARAELVRQLVAIEAVGAPPEIERQRVGRPVEQRIAEWFAERRAAAAAAPPEPQPSFEAAVARMRARHPYLTEPLARHLTRHGLRRGRDGGLRWKHDPFLAVWAFPDIALAEAERLWARIACPTLLIHGVLSWPSGVPARLCELIPDVRELRFEHSGHWPQHDAPAACHAAIRAFLGPAPG